ncbi:MAG: YHS domain-containing protein [Deltaproteobacteria bacterium]|nr:YHS domain-containing protein [Deltaproteobacteria bacterium]
MNLFNKINKTTSDPVCGMAVESNKAEITVKIDGETYFFCAESCRKSFVENPKKYLCHEPTKKKGIWGRYLTRLEKASGGKPMKCH